jgi:benzil reductase ((S)-benzoin forming)
MSIVATPLGSVAREAVNSFWWQTDGMQLTIISGASSGIGQALADQSASKGHNVATISRRPGPGEFLEADLANPDSWPVVSQWIDGLVESQDWERVVFVHNAGVIEPVGFAGETDMAAYTANTLLNGSAPVVLGAGFIASATKADCAAHLMLVSSGAGRRAIKGWSSYCAGKAATDMWAQAAGMEQAHKGSAITITSIAPGVVDTGMQATIRSQKSESFPDIDNFIDLKESGSLRSAEEVGETLLELSSIDAGQPFRGINIDNGALLNIADFS